MASGRTIRVTWLVVAATCLPLGALWFLQGIGAVHVRPLLCFADCAPIQDASARWAAVGLLFVVLGALAVWRWRAARVR